MSLPPTRPAPRLFTETALAPGLTISVNDAQAHYLRHVMRLQPNDCLRLFNGRDGEWRAHIAGFSKKSVELVAETQTREQSAAPDIWLCAAPVRKAHFDYMLEKATELGIAVLQPVLTERTQVREANTERLRLLAIEAAEQSERLDIPAIHAPLKLPDLIARREPDRLLIICAEWGEAQPIAEAFAALPAKAAPKAGIFTGPEGGFTSAELDALRELPNALPVRLGPRILRADTAAIAALSVWQAMKGDWK